MPCQLPRSMVLLAPTCTLSWSTTFATRGSECRDLYVVWGGRRTLAHAQSAGTGAVQRLFTQARCELRPERMPSPMLSKA